MNTSKIGNALKKIKDKNWWKFWALNLSLLNASMLCKNYMKFLKKQLGADFDNAIIISKEGHSTSFLVAEERQKFGGYLIKKYARHGDVGNFCLVFNKKTDDILATMKKLMRAVKITKLEFGEFLKQSYDYNGFYMVPRAIIDYIDESRVNQVIEGLRDSRKRAEPIYTKIEEVTKKFAVQVGRETNYRPEFILCLLIDELENYLTTGRLPKKEVLEKRLKGCGVIFNKRETILFLNPRDISWLENINVKDCKVTEIKGNTAFKGRARGIVRIIHNPYKCRHFDKGDILITGMTRPEFVPLMKKAGAIVTDAGGLLCHAAIVARELAKPCIISTQIATKVFKDGDLVEVDADKGIVRKL